MSTTSETELRAEIAWLEARNREVNLQRIEAETVARSQAARLSELERENARLRDVLERISQWKPKSAILESECELMQSIARAALAGSGEK